MEGKMNYDVRFSGDWCVDLKRSGDWTPGTTDEGCYVCFLNGNALSYQITSRASSRITMDVRIIFREMDLSSTYFLLLLFVTTSHGSQLGRRHCDRRGPFSRRSITPELWAESDKTGLPIDVFTSIGNRSVTK